MPLLLPGAPQSDPGLHLYLETRKTHLVPEYVYLSNDYQLPLLGTRPWTPPPALKKQPNTPQVDLSSKLASNGKLTSDKHKKHLENNLCLYCSVEDHKLDSCSKKQTIVFSKGCSASATTDTLAAASEKPSER